MNRYYLAYGSNLNLAQMEYRCPTAKQVGTYLLKDHELEFRYFLTIKPSIGKGVPLGIFKTTEADEHSLDRYEGYPAFYRKECLTIELDGNEIQALVYIMNESTRDIASPSERYINTCLKGYRDFGFDPKYLKEALENSW